MPNYYTEPVASSCQTMDMGELTYCLPAVEDCTEENSWVKDCDDLWNCNLCPSDTPYHIPYIRGDKIMIQTQFIDKINPDRENPVAGFGTGFITVTFHGSDTTTTNLNYFASRWMVAWSGDKSYQIIEVDTSRFKDVCWSLKFVVNGLQGSSQEYCTEEFQEILACKTGFVQIRSTGSDYDCQGNYYGAPEASSQGNFVFDNTIRLDASFRLTGGSITRSLFAKKVTNTDITKGYTLALGTPIPPYMHEMLMDIYLGMPITWIDGEQYLVENFAPNNRIDYNNMLLYNVPMTTTCDSDKTINKNC